MHHQSKNPFEEICGLIQSVDPNGDAIMQTLQLRTISEKFRTNVKDEKQLSEIFDMFNGKALDDEEFTYSFTVVITSRQLDTFNVNGKNLRHSMLSVLQKNFQNADNFKRDNMQKFYNSIKLLGEYFNRARLSNGVPINIIGQSLLNLINVELEKELRNICHLKNEQFAKLVLSQIALNGYLLKTRHKTEMEQVLFTIRKCLIELDSLTPKIKAFLIMTLDLYYSNFTKVGDALEKMYETFLIEDIKVVTRNNAVESNTSVVKGSENEKAEASHERMSNSKKGEERRKSSESPARNLRVQIRKPDYVKNGPTSPLNNIPRSPQKTSPPNQSSSQRTAAQSSYNRIAPQTRGAPQSPLPRNASKSASVRSNSQPRPEPSPRLSQSSGFRSLSHSRAAPELPRGTSHTYNRSLSQTPSAQRAAQPPANRNSSHSSKRSSSLTPSTRRPIHATGMKNEPQSPTNRNAPTTSKEKMSPQELRNKYSPQTTNGFYAPPNSSSKSTESVAIEKTNATDENILRQQNSRSSTPSSTAAPTKHKVNSKVYFREENVENLTWNGENSFEGDPDDPDQSTSPKINPYSSSFLNFLKTN